MTLAYGTFGVSFSNFTFQSFCDQDKNDARKEHPDARNVSGVILKYSLLKSDIFLIRVISA